MKEADGEATDRAEKGKVKKNNPKENKQRSFDCALII